MTGRLAQMNRARKCEIRNSNLLARVTLAGRISHFAFRISNFFLLDSRLVTR